MNDQIEIIVNETVEDVTINVTCDDETVELKTTDTIENVVINVSEPTFIPSSLWINLVTGWKEEPLLQASTLEGEVYEYQYLPNITYYRYIATDGSIDAFYDSFTFPDTLGNLITEKRIIV